MQAFGGATVSGTVGIQLHGGNPTTVFSAAALMSLVAAAASVARGGRASWLHIRPGQGP